MNYERLLTKIISDEGGARSLWRMSGGSRSKSIEAMKLVAAHYKGGILDTPEQHQEFEWAFDTVLAEIAGGGCEIEWERE